jgi:hypothetical protein
VFGACIDSKVMFDEADDHLQVIGSAPENTLKDINNKFYTRCQKVASHTTTTGHSQSHGFLL